MSGRSFAVGVGEVLSAAVLVVGIIVWAVRLEGRINAADRALGDVKAQHAQAVQQFREDLAYIRQRIDAALAR